MTQPPSARLPGTLQQLEPPLLQEPKAFVPPCQGCQGCQGRREAATPRWDPGRPHCRQDFGQTERRSPSLTPTPGFFKLLGPSGQGAP